jgi:release factor glutamine methyltransferase
MDEKNSKELKDIFSFESDVALNKAKNKDELVYLPQEDTYLLCDASDEFAKGNVLEVGCGSGFIAVELAKKGLNVSAVDINPYAIKETLRLAESENVVVDCFVSDLFENVTDEYDSIIFNPPYLPEDEREPNDLIKIATTGGSQGYEVINRFLEDARHYLKQGGIILLLFSSLTDKKMVDDLIGLYGYEKDLIREQKLFFEKLYVYKLSRV